MDSTFDLSPTEITVLLAHHYRQCEQNMDEGGPWLDHWIRGLELACALPDAPEWVTVIRPGPKRLDRRRARVHTVR